MGWKLLNELPVARHMAAAATWREFLYVLGGATNAGATTVDKSILKSRVDVDGNGNSPWVSCATDFPTGKTGAKALVLEGSGGNGVLMVFGGRGATVQAADVNAGRDIWIGKFDADGNIPRWQHLAGAMPTELEAPEVVQIDSHLFCMGGMKLNVLLGFKNQVTDFVAGETVTGAGGATGVVVSVNDAGATGSLVLKDVAGTFVDSEALTGSLVGAADVDGTADIYRLVQTAIYRAKIDSAGQGIGPWVECGLLPGSIGVLNHVTIDRKRLIVSDTTSLYTANVLPSGEILAWKTTVLPESKVLHCMVSMQDNDLILAGGYNGAAVKPSCWSTNIDADGSPKTWSQQAPIPTGVENAGVAVAFDRLFVVGGYTGAAVSKQVAVVRVNSSGQF